jgi:microcystin degradation protein MlrC
MLSDVKRAVVAMMQHETNTFSPVPTPLARFGSDGTSVPTGPEVARIYRGTGTGIGAFLDLASNGGMEVVTPVAGHAAPSGPVQADAYTFMTDAICDAVEAGCDVCFLDLHGAMVTELADDGEGPLLARLRSIAPDLPIAVSLDLHANITDAIVDNCTALVGYKTYPHVDMYAAAEHAGNIVLRSMAGEVSPVMRWAGRPILAQTLRMGHDDEPMGPLLELARRHESEGLLAVSVFGGFPLADIWDAGLSVVTVADGDAGLAAEVRDQMLEAAWAERQEFLFAAEPLATTIARAKTYRDGPTVLLDHADNAASGGTQDTVHVLAEVLAQGLDDVAMFAICDPEAVQQMTAAGVGATVRLSLGGKTDMPSIGRQGEPIEVTGIVGALTDGVFEITAEMGRGTRAAMGPSARLDLGTVQVVVISRQTEPFDLGHLRSLGIEPTEKRYLILKSRIHFRAGFGPITRRELPCNGVGVTSSDNSLFDFQHGRRPIFPLDPTTGPTPEYPPRTIGDRADEGAAR